MTIEQVLKNVRIAVLAETGRKQTPWEASSLSGNFYFTPLKADNVETKVNRDIMTDPATGIEFIFVPGGCFQMGSSSSDAYDDEKPVHKVCLDDFWISRYEVT